MTDVYYNRENPLPIVDGGTAADNASDARDNLGITTGDRTFIGTADEIAVINGDASLPGDVQTGFALNAIFPGTGAITVPRGTTAARPGIPVNGMIRANTDTSEIEFYTGGVWRQPAPPASAYVPENYLTGFIHTVNTIALLQFGPGSCMDSTNLFGIINLVNFTKDITAAWAEGAGLGGLASSLVLAVNTVYYTFAVAKPDGAVDFGFDTDINAVNLLADTTPSGFSLFRRIGSCRTQTGSTNLEVIFNQDDYFYFETPKQDFTVAYAGAGSLDSVVPLSIPTLVPVEARVMGTTFRETAGAAGSRVYLMAINSPGLADNFSSHCLQSDATGGGSDVAEGASFYTIPSLDGSIRMFSVITGAAAAGDSFVSTIGWTDRRGK